MKLLETIWNYLKLFEIIRNFINFECYLKLYKLWFHLKMTKTPPFYKSREKLFLPFLLPEYSGNRSNSLNISLPLFLTYLLPIIIIDWFICYCGCWVAELLQLRKYLRWESLFPPGKINELYKEILFWTGLVQQPATNPATSNQSL